jgi:hypothetical protein
VRQAPRATEARRKAVVVMGLLLGKMNVAMGEHAIRSFYSEPPDIFLSPGLASGPSLLRDPQVPNKC